MGITGYDNIVFTNRRMQEFLLAMLTRVSALWPAGHIEMWTHDNDDAVNERLSDVIVDPLFDDQIEMLVLYRDSRALQVFEEFGYALDANGEGPFAIHLSRFAECHVTATGVTSPRSDPLEFPVEPYFAHFCLNGIVEVTLVTPLPPKDDTFSARVLEMVTLSCRISEVE